MCACMKRCGLTQTTPEIFRYRHALKLQSCMIGLREVCENFNTGFLFKLFFRENILSRSFEISTFSGFVKTNMLAPYSDFLKDSLRDLPKESLRDLPI